MLEKCACPTRTLHGLLSFWSTDKFLQILLVGVALGRAPILTQFLLKQTRFALVRRSPVMYLNFPNFVFFKSTMTNPIIKRLFTRTICFSKLYQTHTGHSSKRSDSWRPKGARHVWGRSVKRLGLIAGVSFRRLTLSPYCLFFELSRSFPPVRERLEKERKRVLRRLYPL